MSPDDQALDRVLKRLPPRSAREAKRMRGWRRLLLRAAELLREERRQRASIAVKGLLHCGAFWLEVKHRRV